MAKLEMHAKNLEEAKKHLMSILAVNRFNMEAVTVDMRHGWRMCLTAMM